MVWLELFGFFSRRKPISTFWTVPLATLGQYFGESPFLFQQHHDPVHAAWPLWDIREVTADWIFFLPSPTPDPSLPSISDLMWAFLIPWGSPIVSNASPEKVNLRLQMVPKMGRKRH
ncbi:hypothetical protein TNIN_495261 [Trichonephila inaurata madagascariensis]|uniref:Uncharacterized protein n=1 Tax=Trichonephila inaurata madagascariensis TaxID=2747483 RepID=A0A8X7BYT8_9ARAC|nr:hypothetical protein TNIN_495261 [Trichonephila inaurata madagascariensis]